MGNALFVGGFEPGARVDGQDDAGYGSLIVDGSHEQTFTRPGQVEFQRETLRQTEFLVESG